MLATVVSVKCVNLSRLLPRPLLLLLLVLLLLLLLAMTDAAESKTTRN